MIYVDDIVMVLVLTVVPLTFFVVVDDIVMLLVLLVDGFADVLVVMCR